MLNWLIQKIFAGLHFLRKFFWKKLGGKTFGVRGLLIDQGKILLVQHRYNNFWVMPGGKIDGKDSAEEALKKEFREEVGLEILDCGETLGVYQNNSGGKNDEVTVFVIKKWRPVSAYHKNLLNFLEIKEVRWFDLNELPALISRATKRRLDEYLAGQKNLGNIW